MLKKTQKQKQKNASHAGIVSGDQLEHECVAVVDAAIMDLCSDLRNGATGWKELAQCKYKQQQAWVKAPAP